MSRSVSVSPIRDGGEPFVAGPSSSNFLNSVLALKHGQFFTVRNLNKKQVYQRLVYAEFKYGIRTLLRCVDEGEYAVFLKPERKKVT